MDHYFIFQYKTESKGKIDHTLVLFCCGLNFDGDTVARKLRNFFESNVPPSEIIVIGGEYMRDGLSSEFGKPHQRVLKYIPPYLIEKEVKVFTFNQDGKLFSLGGKPLDPRKANEIFSQGRNYIFKIREGLVKSPSETYHYIFPSRKHSSKFIRAGNTLIDSCEIFFIAMTLLGQYLPHMSHIYCDTSSINSLAFALAELKSRFVASFKHPSIVSFGSYEKFEKFEFYDSTNSLIIISASTSGNIVRRLREHNRSLELENIAILYYLSNDREFHSIVVHDLTYDKESNPNGIKLDEIYENEDQCDLCKAGSYTVKIVGDTFLLEKPKIKTILIEKKDAPTWLSDFMQQFYADEAASLVRCYYGEDHFKTYELFFDVVSILNSFSRPETKFNDYKGKFNKVVNQYVPANLKAIIYLDDEGSRYMAESLSQFHSQRTIPIICSDKNLTDKLQESLRNDGGTVLVVSSCLASGNNLLIINKLLRRFDKLSITFLIAIARTENIKHFKFISSNLSYGKDFGLTSNQVVCVEKVFCSNSTGNSNAPKGLSWDKELVVMRALKQIAEDDRKFRLSKKYVDERIRVLERSNDIKVKGLIHNVFLKNPANGKSLTINKNFAFFDFEGYFKKASQADIYFTVSCILNELRNSSTSDNRITQDEHVRTIIAPENFIRYDDGVIQAAILRTASEEELNYKLDFNLSKKMLEILVNITDHEHDTSGEGLIEFLLAIAVRKLRLQDSHLTELVDKISASSYNPTKLVASFIEKEILKQPKKRTKLRRQQKKKLAS